MEEVGSVVVLVRMGPKERRHRGGSGGRNRGSFEESGEREVRGMGERVG